MLKKFCWIFLVALNCYVTPLKAQYVYTSGNNPDIQQYVQASPDNWDKSIIYVFYSNQPCPLCAQAMGMIYDIYEEYFTNQFNIFEINYDDNDEFGMRLSYDLNQPLSVVLVRIQDGMSRGYVKIDNPQYFVNDPNYFNQNLITQINNFLNM